MNAKYIGVIKSYFREAFELINHPREFYKKIEKQKNLRPSVYYLTFLWVANFIFLLIASLLYAYLLPLFDSSLSAPSVNFFQVIISLALTLFVGLVVGILETFVIALVLHLWIKIFRGKGNVIKSLQLVIYSITPTLLFGWLPLVNILAILYLFYLLFVGGQILHGLPRNRSLIILAVIPVVLFILTTLLQLGAF